MDDENKAYGEGTLTFANGIVQKGTWQNDKFNGYRMMTWRDGSKREGEVKDGYWFRKVTDYE